MKGQQSTNIETLGFTIPRVGVYATIVRDDAILLTEFDGGTIGIHFNFPGGGVDLGESLHEALRREVREETGAEIDVGRLLLIWEYVPSVTYRPYGTVHKVGLLFVCHLFPGHEPRLPDAPDPDQTGVCWLSFSDLATPPHPLLPAIGSQVVAALHASGPLDPFCLTV